MRMAVDRGFYRAMLRDAGRNPFMRTIAWVYFTAVRHGGVVFWSGEKPLRGRREFNEWKEWAQLRIQNGLDTDVNWYPGRPVLEEDEC